MKKIIAPLIALTMLAAPLVASAHPGRTDANGGHTCRTNCEKWGLEYGEYHYHNGGGSNSSGASSVSKPASKPQPATTSTPKSAPKPVPKDYVMDYSLTVYIDGELITDKPKPATHNRVIMLPVKPYLEDYGYTFSWDGKNKKLRIKDDEDDITLTVGRSAIQFTGETFTYNAPVMLINNMVYAPAGFIADALYRDGEYDPYEDALFIFENENTEEDLLGEE